MAEIFKSILFRVYISEVTASGLVPINNWVAIVLRSKFHLQIWQGQKISLALEKIAETSNNCVAPVIKKIFETEFTAEWQ